MAVRGEGRAAFAAVLLMIAGTLNVIYGIAAISDAKFFTDNVQYVFSGLHTWGWITVILGVIEVIAGVSLAGGGTFGRVLGIFAASLVAIESIIAVGGAYPFWSLSIFALSVIILHGLIVYGEPETTG